MILVLVFKEKENLTMEKRGRERCEDDDDGDLVDLLGCFGSGVLWIRAVGLADLLMRVPTFFTYRGGPTHVSCACFTGKVK